MDELRKVARVIGREVTGAPHETLLVVDATTGQNAISQARTFEGAVPVTGIVLTKLDGTSRGGVLVALRHELGLPIRYVGIGEAVEDLRPFEAADFVRALLAPAGDGPPAEHPGPAPATP
jgi:fused signal recognition particle receptor